MLRPAHYKAPDHIIEKMCSLVELLKTEKETYDQAAQSVTDRQLRDNIHILAQENNQYACELASQLRILGTDSEGDGIELFERATKTIEIKPIFPHAVASVDYTVVDIFQICRESEKKMIGAYRELLNEPYLMEELRRMMRYQLNGIMYAFLRLKLLSSTLA